MNFIKKNIIIYFSAVVVIILIFFSFIIYKTTENINYKAVEMELNEKILLFENFFKEQRLNSKDFSIPAYLKNTASFYSSRITLTDKNGNLIYDSTNNENDSYKYLPEIYSAVIDGYGKSVRIDSYTNVKTFFTAKKSGDYILRISKPVTSINSFFLELKSYILSFFVFIIISAGMLYLFLHYRITLPSIKTILFTDEFISGNNKSRIINYRNDEIGRIQAGINKICDNFNFKIDKAAHEQNRFKITFENIMDGIAVIGTDNTIIISNKSFNSFFGYDSASAGNYYYEIIRNSNINSKIGSSLFKKNEYIFQDKLLNGRNYDISIRPIHEESSLEGIIVSMRDITERIKMEQIKTDLIGNMSHELKTPITILKGYLETIEGNQSNIKLTGDLLRKAIENADRQNAIINDILKLHMLESGSEIQIELINPGEIISNCVNLLSPKSSMKQLEVINKISGIKSVPGNKFLAEEIFYNLIDNAINYNNPNGKVILDSIKFDGYIEITISDTGVGIPSDSIDRIFERFFRVDKSRTRATGGTGLGLAIVKHACELLNWKIKVHSDNTGSVFTVTI